MMQDAGHLGKEDGILRCLQSSALCGVRQDVRDQVVRRKMDRVVHASWSPKLGHLGMFMTFYDIIHDLHLIHL